MDLARFNEEIVLEMTRSWPGALEARFNEENCIRNDEILAWSSGGLDLARFNKEMRPEIFKSKPGALEAWI